MKDSRELLEFPLRKMVSLGMSNFEAKKQAGADDQMVGLEDVGYDGGDGPRGSYQ